MSPDRLKQIEDLYHAAVQQPGADRREFLDKACNGDTGLRADVESLLKENGDDSGLLRHAAWQAAGPMMSTTAPALPAGKSLNQYELRERLGRGGMGEVYRARDSKLQRDVAIKVLPTEFASDPDRLARFQREAKALAALNHPNINAIYDLQEANGIRFLVLELIDGDTLADVLKKRGQLPLSEALQIVQQVCEALEAAHSKGIIHRDLKPSNIQITPNGKVKLLDFGLAKQSSTDSSVRTSDSVLTSGDPLTEEGLILGTLPYMSPEQVEGLHADARSDIFAFGAVLFEMVTGRKAFEGKSQQRLVSAILSVDPPSISSLQPLSPPALDHLVQMCLAKDPADRWQTAHNVLAQLKWIASGRSQAAAVTRSRFRDPAFIAVCAALLIALVALGFYLRPKPAHPERVFQFNIPEPEKTRFPSGSGSPNPTVSPDGRFIVFNAIGENEGTATLWLRPLDKDTAQKLPGTEGGIQPFWSPDSRSIGFFANGKVQRIDISGGPPQILADLPSPEGGAWGVDGTILLGRLDGGLMRVQAVGGVPTPLNPLPINESQRYPIFLPDGRHFVYLVAAPNRAAYWGSLDSPERKVLLNSDVHVLYAAPGYLLFVRGGTLTAQAFDAARGQTLGDPFPIADNVRFNRLSGAASFSVSTNGTLTYLTGAGQENDDLEWFDRNGHLLNKVGDPGNYQGIALSPDGKQLAVHLHEPGAKGDIWLMDLIRGPFTRFTFDASRHFSQPVWSPDGGRLAYVSDRPNEIIEKSSNNAGGETNLYQWPANTPLTMNVDSWSPDGKVLLFDNLNPKGSDTDLWILPVDGDHQPHPYFEAPFNQVNGQFSPDGRWVAYSSNESGRFEVYIRPFPDAAGGVWQVSTTGANNPLWRGDGQELFYMSQDGKLMAADVKASNAVVHLFAPHELFTTHAETSLAQHRAYSVTADGRRFLIASLPGPSAGPVTPITVVVNWTAALKK